MRPDTSHQALQAKKAPWTTKPETASAVPSPSTLGACGIQCLDHLTAGWQGPSSASIIPFARARHWLAVHFYPSHGGGLRAQGHSSLVTPRLRLFLSSPLPKGEEELKNITLTALEELRM